MTCKNVIVKIIYHCIYIVNCFSGRAQRATSNGSYASEEETKIKGFFFSAMY